MSERFEDVCTLKSVRDMMLLDIEKPVSSNSQELYVASRTHLFYSCAARVARRREVTESELVAVVVWEAGSHAYLETIRDQSKSRASNGEGRAESFLATELVARLDTRSLEGGGLHGGADAVDAVVLGEFGAHFRWVEEVVGMQKQERRERQR